MLIYNITMNIPWSLQQRWLDWMNEVYIPKLLNTDCFEKYQLVKLLEVEEAEGPTYALQLYLVSKAQYNRYHSLHNHAIKQLETDAWGDAMLSFSTLMEVVN